MNWRSADYPHAEFLTPLEMQYCEFERWRWQQGDDR
jgi:hypothetical protein